MGPLTGLKILDFSTLLPGPYATHLLSEMGAEVLRIVSPSRPDLMQQFPAIDDYLNGGKQRLLLDLTQPEVSSQVRELLADYDIVLEQFRPGVMGRFGLGYDDLQADFPALIYCSLTGYGQTGPLKDRAGHDINYQALTGVASYGGSEHPVLTATPVADLAGGSLHAVIAILAALNERHQTGLGQYLDVAMADAMLALNAMEAPQVLAGKPGPTPQSGWLNGGLFYDYYRCADDLWLAVGGLEPKFIQALCQGLGKAEWVPRFLDVSAESQHSLRFDLAELFASQTRAVWLARLESDCCVEPVLTLAEALQHPQFKARGMVDHQLGHLGCPLRFPGSSLHRS
ncbi:MAG: CoA transferase [Saccharospirillum sp.]|nr:CoA transferase [Saccharospirillum sp.]